MDPITTPLMIGGFVSYLGNKLAKNESVNSFFSEFTDASVNWIKPLFLTEEGIEKEMIQKLKEKPDSKARKKAVESALEIELEDNPNAEAHLKAMFEKLSKTEEGGKIVTTITNSKNVNTGNVNTGGGDFHIGD
jgi:hypothetical protein